MKCETVTVRTKRETNRQRHVQRKERRERTIQSGGVVGQTPHGRVRDAKGGGEKRDEGWD